RVNDAHGHAAGDAVLMQMRGRLEPVFRATDWLVRWGGEEFLIVARSISRQHAAELAERVRAAVAGQPFVLDDGRLLQRSCSLGFACFPLAVAHPRALDWSATLDLADAALYAAKRSGRNAWAGVVDAGGLDESALRQRRSGTEWLEGGELRLLRSG
ncbi:MAG: GGDEF domain-containing protein, partial [Xanthomonas sp.]|nr:GGDEF domain-containing protein [Xanthomonas sp.]